METIDVIKMADDILAGADFDENYIEHHGVKGQRWGERKFQYKDGSLTALGRQHYGIGSWIKSRFSSAERGYRAAVKQKQQQQKIAVKKAKYAGDLKKMIKNKKLFTDAEINQQIMDDTRRQQALNHLKDLSNADKIRRQNEKIEKQERRDARKAQRFEQKMQKEALKAETQQKLNEQKTQLDIQKQKDKAQAEREQAQRDYQTQQKIAEGKTLLSKLQKGAKMAAAVSAIVGSTKKTFELLGFNADKMKDATKAVEKVKGAAEKLKEQAKATGETETKPKDEKKSTFDFDPINNPRKIGPKEQKLKDEHHEKAVKEWEQWQNNNAQKYNVETWRKNNRPILDQMATKRFTDKEDSKRRIEMRQMAGRILGTEVLNYKGGTDRSDLTSPVGKQKASQSTPITPPKTNVPDRSDIVSPVGKKQESSSNRVEPPKVSASARTDIVSPVSAKREAEAKEQAREIKERWNKFYQFQQQSTGKSEPKSATGSFITSVSPTKLTDMLLGRVSKSEYPYINLGTAMNKNIGEATDYMDEMRKRKEIQRNMRYGTVHRADDMQEDAGEVEDAE